MIFRKRSYRLQMAVPNVSLVAWCLVLNTPAPDKVNTELVNTAFFFLFASITVDSS